MHQTVCLVCMLIYQSVFSTTICAKLMQLVGTLTANQEIPGSIPGLVEG